MRRGMFTSTNAARSFIADSSSPSLPSRISEMSTYTIGCVIGNSPIVVGRAQLVIMLHVATLGLALLVMPPPIVQVAALPAEGGRTKLTVSANRKRFADPAPRSTTTDLRGVPA